MKFDLFQQFGALNSPPIFDSFRKGLIKNGHEVSIGTGTGDAAVIWSVLWAGRMRPNRSIWKKYRDQGKPVIVLEVGSLKRGVTWKIGINGINLGSYFNSFGNDDTRAKKLGINLMPWSTNGNKILICGQHEHSQQWEGNKPMTVWVDDVFKELRQYTDRPIYFRSHPRHRIKLNSPIGISKALTFDHDLADTWAVINWNSNPGIESVIKGVPSFVGPNSLARPVSNIDFSKIEDPNRPDRQQWLNDLCWTEWTQEEMEQGIPQELITNFLL